MQTQLMRKHPYLFFTPHEPIGEETIEGLKDKAHMEKFILEIQITKLIKKHLFFGGCSSDQVLSDFMYDLFNAFVRNNPNFNPEVLTEIFNQEDDDCEEYTINCVFFGEES